MSENPKPKPAGRARRVIDKLNQPVDAATSPTTSSQATASSTPAANDAGAPRKAQRTAANRDAEFARKVVRAQASGDPTALLMVYVDRVRAVADPALTRAAASALAELTGLPEPPEA